MRSTLLCFQPASYSKPAHVEDKQCIAPTEKRLRCTWDISPGELQEANELSWQLSSLSDVERTAALERVALLRTCGDCHREKLEYNKECLEQVAKNLEITLISLFAKIPTTPSRRRDSLEPTPMILRSGQLRNRYILRPIDGVIRNSTQLFASTTQTFVPYASSPYDRINSSILDPIKEFFDPGFVYAFTWPSHPGYVKVGYTSATVQSRILRWQKCFSEAKLLYFIKVEFPERMERLIHLQLAKHRRKIVICQVCSRTHHEWFEVSEELVIQTMNEWKAVVNKSPLYSSEGHVSTLWAELINNSEDEVTAGELMRTWIEWNADPILSMFGEFMRMTLNPDLQ